jgi:hypothetical protein
MMLAIVQLKSCRYLELHAYVEWIDFVRVVVNLSRRKRQYEMNSFRCVLQYNQQQCTAKSHHISQAILFFVLLFFIDSE